jgi:hypothetical protein
MAGRVLQLENLLNMDLLGCEVSKKWHEWNNLRANKMEDMKEVRKYVYQTDTTQTSNVKLPWKNKTTTPKICQIRDNLYANYMQSMFPKRRWLKWEGNDKSSADVEKKKAIENYAMWMIDRPEFRNEISKLVYDFIDAGNAMPTIEWVDFRNQTERRDQTGYVGPVPRRLAPDDIVFNPIAPSFNESPKIVRSLVSLGEVKEYLERISVDSNRQSYEELFSYLRDIRRNVSTYSPDLKDDYFRMDGFTSYRAYLESGYCELLTFYGNMYDVEKDEFLKNYEIVIADRHKVIKKAPRDSSLALPPIYHCGWRQRQDNLWAMGPLDNLVGLQYRIDHLENLKADLFDLTAFPPLLIKGYVEDFEWGPFTKIHTDNDGSVEIMSPDVNALNVNLEIQVLEQKMEEMAGSPREAMGFRTPGEKTAYEVQRLENAASRIFQSKIVQFEEQIVEPLLNGMLEMAISNMDSTMIRIFDEEFGLEVFQTLTPEDISGNGRIRPVAARHFAETAERIQNLTNFANSPLYQDPAVNVHWSGIEIARLIEELLDIEQYNIVEPFIRVTETAEGQKLANVSEEQMLEQTATPSGMTPEDTDEPFV